ncbi:MAG: NADH:flavin oxidoreductase [Acidobacteriota bacterium]|nr:NADH:flavin oxidoreductase [Acidobacteriota bacterium]
MSTAVFASREALEAEIGRLGVQIRLEPDIQASLTPIAIGSRTAGNRFAIHPMEGCDGTLEGAPDELTIRRWGRFASGGAKLLWGEAVAIEPDARANTRQLLLSEQNLPALEQLIAFARKEHGPGADTCLIGLQLTHSGRWSYPTPAVLFHDPALRNNGRIMTDAELDRLQDRYVAAALRARDIGVDFVDIKQCHRYLLSEMLAARTRPGKYGGSLENRTRFVREVLARLASEAPALIRATRMNFFDGVPFAKDPATGAGHPVPGASENYLELDEALAALRMFRDAGLQLVNATAGCPYFNPHIGRPADREPPDGYAAPEPGLVGVERHFRLAEAAQRACPEIPVVGTGYSYLRHFAVEAGEANVRAGRVSLVGLGRGAIAYPDFARDVRMDKRKACITVSYCTTLMRSKGNELGQYAAGCVPRDPVYARLLQVIQKDAKQKAAVPAATDE